MAQIGTLKLKSDSGVVEVPVFEPGDVGLPVVRVQTDSGTGALNVVDTGDAELDQLRVQTSQGVKAVSTTINTVFSYEDDFTTDTTDNYSIELSSSSPSYSYSSSNDAIYFDTTDNDHAYVRKTFSNMSSSGYVKITNNITGDDPYGETVGLSIYNSSTGDRYRATNRDGSYTEGLYKTVNGSTTDSFTQNGSSNHSRRTIEMWWSPTHLKVAFNGNVQWDVDTTDTTDIHPDTLEIRLTQINTYLEYIQLNDNY
ncbi:hypothetical protein ACK3SF_02365 [Candidatus Nanosalina sp. VS9-1]|uniref:hypothetical protein n=1 Tax=Candidatus Nanosalina sp. VS9-1 TaxID=3388566 RepID=UPI0039E128F2